MHDQDRPQIVPPKQNPRMEKTKSGTTLLGLCASTKAAATNEDMAAVPLEEVSVAPINTHTCPRP